MRGLNIEDISKRYDETIALAGVSLTLSKGETLALLGPSGCGKSTLLSIVAGLEEADTGVVAWQGEDLSGVPPHLRGFGLMFQDYALFPHMAVGANVAFGLRMAGAAQAEQQARVRDVLALVGLPGFEDRQVTELSGGEQQRVALARALANQPALLMLDEPLGSLDRALRERLLDDLRVILRSTGQTTLYVTHDQEEAFALADQVAVMRKGQIAQVGTPKEIYCQPNSAFVARFVGLNNLLPGEVVDGRVITALGEFPAAADLAGPVEMLLRPDGAVLTGEGEVQISGKVLEVTFRGGTSRVTIAVNGTRLQFDFVSGSALPEVGEQIEIGLDARSGVQCFLDNSPDMAAE